MRVRMLVLLGEDPAGLQIDCNTKSPHGRLLLPARAHSSRLDDVLFEHPGSTMAQWVTTAKMAESLQASRS